MKIVKTLPFAAIILFSCAPQLIQFSEEENLVKVFEDVAGSKDQLYLKANAWMVNMFNSAESVVQHQDKEEGVIIGKFMMGGEVYSNTYATSDSRVFAIIDIRVKDNKARIEIKPQGQWRYDPSGITIYNISKQDVIAHMDKLADMFHASLLKEDIKF